MIKTSRFLSGSFLLMLGVSPIAFCATEPISGIDTAIQQAQEEVRDPFAVTAETKAAVTAAPAISAAPAGPVVKVLLEGIGFSSKNAYALIGGDVYYVGDEKNGIKLVEVRRREVDVMLNSALMTIPLFPKEELQKLKDRADKKVASRNDPEGRSVEGASSFVVPGDGSSSLRATPLPKLEGDA